MTLATCVGLLLSGCGSGADAAETWEIEGPLLAWDADIWVIDGEAVVMPGPLNRDDERRLGAVIRASGTYDESGLRIASAVEVTGEDAADSTLDEVELDGTIEEVEGPGGSVWTVDGTTVLVPDATWVTGADGADVAALWTAGSFAEITGYRIADKRVMATEVVLRPGDGASDDAEGADRVDPLPWAPAGPMEPVVPYAAPDDDSDAGTGDDGSEPKDDADPDEDADGDEDAEGEEDAADDSSDKPDKPEDGHGNGDGNGNGNGNGGDDGNGNDDDKKKHDD